MVIFKLLLALVAGYMLGSLNTGIIVGGFLGENIRAKGSGNAGLTNTLRVMGPGAALIVLAGDILKSVAACMLGYLLTANELGPERMFDFEAPNLGLLLAGTSCIFGHVFPVFFRFKGGKGVLTTATVVFFIDWRLGAIALCIFIIMLLLSRYVSLSSLVAAAGLLVTALIMGKPMYTVVYFIAIVILIFFMHRKNIGRLLNGTEPKLRANS